MKFMSEENFMPIVQFVKGNYQMRQNFFGRAFNWLRIFIEEIIPSLLFAILFVVFIAGVISRYVFSYPLSWSYDITAIAYLWMVVLGACYTTRKKSHVMFTLIYDLLERRKQAALVFLGDLIIAVTFIALFVPSWQFITKMKIQKTGVLGVPFSVIYSPFIVFVIIIVLYMIMEMYECLRIFMNKTKGGMNQDD